MAVASGLYQTHGGESKPSSDTGALSNEGRRRAPTTGQTDSLGLSPAIPRIPPQLSFEQHDSTEPSATEDSPSSHTALISTRDLMALDRYSAGKAAGLASPLLLSPTQPSFHFISPGTSPSNRYLPPGTKPLLIPSHGEHSLAPPPCLLERLDPRGSTAPLWLQLDHLLLRYGLGSRYSAGFGPRRW